MTIYKLHKMLGILIEHGHARTSVVVDKHSFDHPLEDDGVCLITLDRIEVDTFGMLDDDGGTAFLANGQEKTQTSLVLIGDGDDWKKRARLEEEEANRKPVTLPK